MHDHQRLKQNIQQYQNGAQPPAAHIKHNIQSSKGGFMNSMRMFTYNIKQANTSTVLGTVVLIIAVIMLIYYFKNKGSFSNVKINEIKYDFF
jgi:hypothetical protein